MPGNSAGEARTKSLAGNAESSHLDGVRRKSALGTTSTIFDNEWRRQVLESRGRRGLKQRGGIAAAVTVGRCEPQVGAPCVEDDVEGFGGRAYCYRAYVARILRL